jgi:DNA-binding MarR family transcriptional regulator
MSAMPERIEGSLNDDPIADWAMARTVKRARVALQGALIAGLRADGSVLRAAHSQVFEAIDPTGSRLSTLAERAGMSHQAMSELVAELIETGHLERVPDPSDGRAKLLRPTAQGRAELAGAAVHLREVRRRWQERLGDLTVDQVVAGLAELIDICDELEAGKRDS